MFDDFEDDYPQEADFNIDITGFSQKSLICGMYHKLSQFERHFDSISTNYKKMVLTWILATFAGVGFFLSIETSQLPFHHLLAVILICFLGMVGTTAIWHLDMNVYHQFWSAIYIEEMVMETKYHFLVPSRNTVMLIDDNRDRIFAQSFIYIIANGLFIISMATAVFYLIEYKKFCMLVEAIAFFVVFLVTYSFFIFHASRRMRDAFNLLVIERKKSLQNTEKQTEL